MDFSGSLQAAGCKFISIILVLNNQTLPHAAQKDRQLESTLGLLNPRTDG